jgi:hypothetical protein
MIRQLLIAAVMGLALSACGVGYDEDLASLGIAAQAVDQATVATQDPVPPKTEPTTIAVVFDLNGNSVVITGVSASSGAPGNPGDQNSSSQDPIPPKNGLVAYGRPVPGDNPNDHHDRIR